MKKGCGCWKTERDRRNRRSRKNGTDDGGAPRRFAASCGGDRRMANRRRRERPCRFAASCGGDRMAKQTTAEAPIPLCPPTPSLGHMWDIEKAGRNRLSRFPADAVRSDEKLRPLCKHRPVALSSFLPPAFFIVCATILLHRPAAERHVRVMRSLFSFILLPRIVRPVSCPVHDRWPGRGG